MTPDWDKVESDPEFRALPEADKLRVRTGFFEDNVAPNVPKEHLEAVRRDFMSYKPEPSMPDNVVAAAKAAGRLIGEQLRATRDAAAAPAQAAEAKTGKDLAAAGEAAAHSSSPAYNVGGELNDGIKVITKSVAESAKIRKAHEELDKEISEGLPEFKDFSKWMARSKLPSLAEKLADTTASGVAAMTANIMRVPALAYDVAVLPTNLGLKAIGRGEDQLKSPDWLMDNQAARYWEAKSKEMAAQVPDLSEDELDLLRKRDLPGFARVVAFRTVQNAPNMAAMLAATAAGAGIPALVGMGVMSASDANKAARAAGADPAMGTINAGIHGTIEAAAERMGTLNFIERWGASLAKTVGKENVRSVIAAVGKTIAAGMWQEGMEEGVTSAGQDISSFVTGVDKNALEGGGARMVKAAIGGAAMGAAMTGPGAVSAGMYKAQIAAAKADGNDAAVREMTQKGVIKVVGKEFWNINKKMGEEATPAAVKAAAADAAAAVQKELSTPPWAGAVEPAPGIVPEAKPLPIDVRQIAPMVIAAGVDGPEMRKMAADFPWVYAASSGNGDVPQAVKVKYEAWQESIAQKLELPPGAPITAQVVAHAIKTGRISYIETAKLNQALFEAEAAAQGAHPGTISTLYADGVTAAEQPAEALVAVHAEKQAATAFEDARGRAARITEAEAEAVAAQPAPTAPAEAAVPVAAEGDSWEDAALQTLPPRASGLEQAVEEGIPLETAENGHRAAALAAQDAGVLDPETAREYAQAGDAAFDPVAAEDDQHAAADLEKPLGEMSPAEYKEAFGPDAPPEVHARAVEKAKEKSVNKEAAAKEAKHDKHAENSGQYDLRTLPAGIRYFQATSDQDGWNIHDKLNALGFDQFRAVWADGMDEAIAEAGEIEIGAEIVVVAGAPRVHKKKPTQYGYNVMVRTTKEWGGENVKGGQPGWTKYKNKGRIEARERLAKQGLVPEDVFESTAEAPAPIAAEAAPPTAEAVEGKQAPVEAEQASEEAREQDGQPESAQAPFVAWERTKFSVPTLNGGKVVTGDVAGAYGIVKGKRSKKISEWTVYHMPTGLRVTTEVSEEEARRMAEALMAKVPELASLTDVKAEGSNEILKKALAVIQDLRVAMNPGKGLKKDAPGATILAETEDATKDDETEGAAGQPGEGTGPEPVGPEGLLQIAGDEAGSLQSDGEGRVSAEAPEGPRDGLGEPGGESDGAPGQEGGPAESGESGRGDAGPGHLPAVPRVRDVAQQPGNLRITAETELEPAGKVARFNANVQAIKTLRAIEAEGRMATPAEQAILVKYVGWGQLKNAFETYYGEPAWQKRAEELQELLTEDEYAAARKSTQNAHYTSREIIGSIYRAIESMGFRGGRILEPSMGVGHFFGLLPDSMGGSSLVGVEIDNLTARIAKQLYQSADVRASGFEDVKLPNGYFDLAISNVPFSEVGPFDPEYNKFKYPLHDYFIVKSMDKVRPGGIVAVVTSRYSMDKLTSSWRDKVYEQADLLGAVRLPETAFKGNADTSVVTDILFLRKRMAGEQPGDSSWLHAEKKTRGEYEEYSFNRYFSEHPEMIVGNVSFKRGQFSANDFTVKHEGDFQAALDAALDRLPKDVYSESSTETKSDALKQSDDAAGVKKGGHVIKDGKVYQRKGEDLVEKAGADAARISALINLLGAMNKTISTQQNEAGDEAVKESIGELNATYDKFVKKYGEVNSRANRSALENDPDLPRLMALENQAGKSWEKADIFHKPVIRASKKVESIAEPADALNVVLNEVGRVDLDRVAAMTGKTVEDVTAGLKGLIYRNPDGGVYEIADVYLSGNVKAKLAAARAAADLDRAYSENVAALELVQPKDLEAHEVTVNLGVPWVPADVIRDFVDYLTDVRRSVKVAYAPLIGRWVMEHDYNARGLNQSVGNNSTWGTSRMDAVEIVKQILDGKQPTIYDGSGDDKVVNQPETDAVRQKMEDIEERFKSWIFETKERRDPLLKLYNETMNTHRVVKPNGDHLTMPGSSPDFTWRKHQKDAVFRAIVSHSNLLLAHEVGTGKTAVMAGIAMEARRLGIAKKPMIVTLKSNSSQIIRDFRKIYPTAKLLTFGEGDLGPQNRGEFMSRIATGDWDAVIVTHPSLVRLPMSRNHQIDFYRKQVVEIVAAMESAKMAGGKTSRMVKELAKSADRIETKMKLLADKIAKDDTITFEELGVDMLLVDESQEFKNLYFPTSVARGVKGLGAGSDTARSFDMFMKTQYISKLNNGRGVIFATGTPISNSMSEVYTLQRYLANDELMAEGLNHFDAWARTYGKIVNSFELKPSGEGYRVVQRFAKFQNVSELMRRYLQFADVVRADNTNIVRPSVATGKTQVVAVPSSPMQKSLIKSLVDRYANLKVGGTDNALVITTDGRKGALDMRLLDKSLPDDPGSKLNEAVGRIFKIWNKHKADKLTQVVFCDLGVPGEDDKFNVYADIKAKLMAFGVPKEEIAFIHDAKTDEAKDALFARVRAGDVRVIIGSSKKMGIGVNIQTLLKAGHRLDAPWRPDLIEQGNGRLVRQGNRNADKTFGDKSGEVELYQYVTENTFDAYIFQALEAKARSFEPVLRGEYDLREIDDLTGAALSYEEVKAIASGNPLVTEKIKVSQEVRKLQSLEIVHKKGLVQAQSDLAMLPDQIKVVQARVARMQADAEAARKHVGEFKMTVDGKVYTERKAAGEAIMKFASNAVAKGAVGALEIGTYRGFSLISPATGRGLITISGKDYYQSAVSDSAVGTVASLDHATNPDTIIGHSEDIQKNIAVLEKRLSEIVAETTKPFKYAERLAELRAREKKIDHELGSDQSDKGAAEGPPDAGELSQAPAPYKGGDLLGKEELEVAYGPDADLNQIKADVSEDVRGGKPESSTGIAEMIEAEGLAVLANLPVRDFQDTEEIIRFIRNGQTEILAVAFGDEGKVIETQLYAGQVGSITITPEMVESWQARAKALGTKYTPIHNHPSGDPTLSAEDHQMAVRLREMSGDAFVALIATNGVEYEVTTGDRESKRVAYSKPMKEYGPRGTDPVTSDTEAAAVAMKNAKKGAVNVVLYLDGTGRLLVAASLGTDANLPREVKEGMEQHRAVSNVVVSITERGPRRIFSINKNGDVTEPGQKEPTDPVRSWSLAENPPVYAGGKGMDEAAFARALEESGVKVGGVVTSRVAADGLTKGEKVTVVAISPKQVRLIVTDSKGEDHTLRPEDFMELYRKRPQRLAMQEARRATGEPNAPIKGIVQSQIAGLAPSDPAVSEQLALREALRKEAKGAAVAAREGARALRHEIRRQLQQGNWEQATRAKIVELAKEALPPAERGAMLTQVANARDQGDLLKAFWAIEKKADDVHRKESIEEIKVLFDRVMRSPTFPLGVKKLIQERLQGIRFENWTARTIDKIKAEEALIQAMEASGENLVVPRKLLDKIAMLSSKPLGQMPVSAIDEILEFMKQASAMGGEIREIMAAMEEAARVSDLKEMTEGPDKIKGIQSRISKEGAVSRVGDPALTWVQENKNKFLRAMDAAYRSKLVMTPMQMVAEIIDGKDDGPVTRLVMERIQNKFSDFLVDDHSYLRRRDVMLEKWGNIPKEEADRIGIIIHAAQEGGREKLHQLGADDEMIDSVLAEFNDPGSKNYARHQEMVAYLRETIQYRTEDMIREEAFVHNKDVQLVKDYFPMLTDHDFPGEAHIQLDPSESFSNYRRQVEAKFLKERVANAKQKIVLDPFKAIDQHMQKKLWFVHTARVLKQVNAIVKDPAFQQAAGDVGATLMNQYLDALARMGGVEGARKMRFLADLRRGMGAASICFNPGSVLIQPSSLADGAARIGGKWVGRGMTLAADAQWQEVFNTLAPKLKYRGEGRNIYTDVMPGQRIGMMERLGSAPIRFGDEMASRVVFGGAYALYHDIHGLEMRLDRPSKEAAKFAQKVMDQTQASPHLVDMPLMMSGGRLTGNVDVDRALAQFQLFLMNRASHITDDIIGKDWRRGDKMKAVERAAWLGSAMAYEAGMGTLLAYVAAMFAADPKEEKDKLFQKLSLSALSSFVPILPNAMQSIMYGQDILPAMSIIYKGVKGGSSAMEGSGLGKASIPAALGAVAGGYLFGARGVAMGAAAGGAAGVAMGGATKIKPAKAAKGIVDVLAALGALKKIPGSFVAARMLRKAIPKDEAETRSDFTGKDFKSGGFQGGDWDGKKGGFRP